MMLLLFLDAYLLVVGLVTVVATNGHVLVVGCREAQLVRRVTQFGWAHLHGFCRNVFEVESCWRL